MSGLSLYIITTIEICQREMHLRRAERSCDSMIKHEIIFPPWLSGYISFDILSSYISWSISKRYSHFWKLYLMFSKYLRLKCITNYRSTRSYQIFWCPQNFKTRLYLLLDSCIINTEFFGLYCSLINFLNTLNYRLRVKWS